jgi:hypothetical protein
MPSRVWTLGPILGLAACAALAFGARADDKKDKTVDCADIAMQFAAPGFTVKCQDLSDGNVSDGMITTGIRTEVLEADSPDHLTYLGAVDQRVLGNYAMRRYSMIDDVRSYFNEQHIDDWTPTADADGFKVATYTSQTERGAPIDCIAFRREVTRKFNGVGRLVVGISCSLKERDAAMNALKHLDAPGG